MKEETLKLLDSAKARQLMGKLYGENGVDANLARYRDLVEKFVKEFGDKDMMMFSSPGRTEIGRAHV